MEFEFDPAKSESNHKKHGIDFVDAQRIWLDERHLIVLARSSTEPRYAAIGLIGDKLWTCIFTPRENRIRMISARRSRDEEKEGYYHS
jgi:uncharacterized DUF497 family protein